MNTSSFSAARASQDLALPPLADGRMDQCEQEGSGRNPQSSARCFRWHWSRERNTTAVPRQFPPKRPASWGRNPCVKGVLLVLRTRTARCGRFYQTTRTLTHPARSCCQNIREAGRYNQTDLSFSFLSCHFLCIMSRDTSPPGWGGRAAAADVAAPALWLVGRIQ